MLIATLKTQIISTDPISGGYYEQPVRISRMRLNAAVSPRALIMRTISEHLAVAMDFTETPFLRWQIHFAPAIVSALGVPEIVNLENADDISRLSL